MLGPQRLGDEDVTVKPICQAKSSGDPERQTRADVPERAANRRAENKTETERDADHAKGACAFFFRNNIGDVRHRGWNTRCRDSGNDASKKQPPDCRRERHYDVIEAEAEIRQQNNRASAKFIGQNAQHR